MASQRLTFLYPHMFKPLSKASSSHCPRRAFNTSTKRPQQQFNQRHGSAVEPIPTHLPALQSPAPSPIRPSAVIKPSQEPTVSSTSSKPAIKADPPRPKPSTSALPSQASVNLPDLYTPVLAANATPTPLETVLHLPSPTHQDKFNSGDGTADSAPSHKPPHLQTPPYTHHFDTFTLVRALSTGDFSNEASVSLMKAVRGLLADNLHLAREGLVSKSNVENTTYLFRAACSELRTEIQNNRNAETDRMRQQRAQLQHELDILNQRMTQELLTLKDDLKGSFDDRKMATRTEQRHMEGKIQELNYKITVGLNSDMKSEVEGLRWVLTRRAAMAIASMALLILGSLRVASIYMHNEEKKASTGSNASGSSSTSSSESNESGGDKPRAGQSESEIIESRAGDATYVSLG